MEGLVCVFGSSPRRAMFVLDKRGKFSHCTSLLSILTHQYLVHDEKVQPTVIAGFRKDWYATRPQICHEELRSLFSMSFALCNFLDSLKRILVYRQGTFDICEAFQKMP
jgi:hypothetical protein